MAPESRRTFPFHFDCSVAVDAPAEAVFARLDDQRLLSAHMSRSSWMMAGSSMSIELDSAKGRAIGSVIRMTGRFVGIPLALEETVTERISPSRKVWETVGTPKLLVIGPYRMGFEIAPQGDASRLRVFIDYSPPPGFAGRVLGPIFGPVYARWCTGRMARDAAQHFSNANVNDQ